MQLHASFRVRLESLSSMSRCVLPKGLMTPKCSSPGDIAKTSAFLDQIAPTKTCGLCALIESSKEVMNAPSIVNSNDRVVAVVFGVEDFSAAIGICRSSDDTGLLYARSAVIVAARSGDKEVYDLSSMDFRDQNAVKTITNELVISVLAVN